MINFFKTVCRRVRTSELCFSSGQYLFGVGVHHIQSPLICLECCEDDSSTDDLCACSEIQKEDKEDSLFEECCKR